MTDGLLVQLLGVLAGTTALVAAAQAAIPAVPVPVTLHSLVLSLLVGLGGPVPAVGASLLYLALIVAGAPVLGGWKAARGKRFLQSASAGYLAAFVPAAAALGNVGQRAAWTGGFWQVFAVVVALHAAILLFGGAWLAARSGGRTALRQSAHLLPGAAAKSVAAAFILVGIRHVFASY